MFTPQELFNLTDFRYRHFFQQTAPAWEALRDLKACFSKEKLGLIEGTIEEGVHLIHPELISIGAGTVVESGAYIIGPCIIGQNCQIRHGAYLRGEVLTGDHVVIGHATEAKHAIFLNGAKAGHLAYVGDSILGNEVNLGAGTKCANLRFDGGTVKVKGIDSGLRKLGALFGDHSQTGCNVVTNPGTIFLPEAVAGPCQSVHGVIRLKVKVS